MKISKQSAFTSIELMIAVAIIAIVVSAVPGYQDYIVRAKVTEGLSLASVAKAVIIENAKNGKAFATGLNGVNQGLQFNMNISTDSVAGIFIDSATGYIDIHYTAQAGGSAGNNIILAPYDGNKPLTLGTAPTSDSITWYCNAGSKLPNGHLGPIGNLPAKYVPANCR